MKKQLLILLLMACTLAGNALEKKAYELVLILKDGSKIIYHLDKKVTMTLGKESIVMTRDDFSAEYALEDIDSFDQKEVEGYIDSLERVSAWNTQQDVVIYSTDGRMVRRITPDSERQATYLLNDLETGAYVISNGTSTYKIVKQ